MKRAPYLILCLTLLFAPSCKDKDLEKVSKALVVTADTLGTIQTAVIDANKQGLLSIDKTRAILEVCLKVDQAGKEAVFVTRQVNKLTEPSKAQILGILVPVIKAVESTFFPDLPVSVKLALESLRSTLNSIQLILAAGG